MDGLSRRLSPQENGNHPDLSIGSMTSSDAMIDSAIDLADTTHPSSIGNGNGGTLNGPCIAGAFTVQSPMIGDSSVGISSEPAYRGDHKMSDVQGDNQRSTQNKLTIPLILNSNSPSLDGYPKPSITNSESTVHLHQSDSAASASEDTT